MTRMRTTMLAITTLLSVGAVAQTATASTYRHIDELALRMQRQSREIYYELAERHTRLPGYGHLRSDAARLYRLAQHIHEVAHRRGSVRHLQDDLRDADRLFHHMGELLERRVRHAHGHRCTDLHCGCRAPRPSGRLRSLMRQLENTLHHLQDDIDDLVSHNDHGPVYRPFPAPDRYRGQNPYTYRQQVQPTVRYDFNRGGVSFSGGRWSFRIR